MLAVVFSAAGTREPLRIRRTERSREKIANPDDPNVASRESALPREDDALTDS